MSRQISMQSKKLQKNGFPNEITEGGRKFQLPNGGMQYWGGDVKRITASLRKSGVHYRVLKTKNNTDMGAYLIYVENGNKQAHLDNFRGY